MFHPPNPNNGHGFYERNEKIRSIKEIAQILQKIGSSLIERSSVKIGNSQVNPKDPSDFIIGYERLPRGELCMKFEIKWEDQQTSEDLVDSNSDISIE